MKKNEIKNKSEQEDFTILYFFLYLLSDKKKKNPIRIIYIIDLIIFLFSLEKKTRVILSDFTTFPALQLNSFSYFLYNFKRNTVSLTWLLKSFDQWKKKEHPKEMF